MRQAKVSAIVLIWAASLLGVGLWAQGNKPLPILANEVVSGDDIGFQRSALPSNGTVKGRFVVKVDGYWYEAVPNK